MIYEFDFYRTDESFDYSDIATEYRTVEHGIEIDMDINNNIYSWRGYGDFNYDMTEIKTLPELKQYILDNMHLVEEVEGERFTRKELLEELIDIIDSNIKKQEYNNAFNKLFDESIDAFNNLGVEKCL